MQEKTPILYILCGLTNADSEEFKTEIAKEIKNNGLNKDLVFNTVAYNAVVDAYEVAIDTTFVQVLAPQVMKATFGLAAEKLGGTIAKLINALDINSIADEELLQDLPSIKVYATKFTKFMLTNDGIDEKNGIGNRVI